MKKSTKILIVVIVAILLIIGIVFLIRGLNGNSATEVGINYIDDNAANIAKVEITGYKVFIYLNGDAKPSKFAYHQGRAAFVDHLTDLNLADNVNIKINLDDPNAGQVWLQMAPILAMLLLGVLFFFAIRQQTKGAGGAMGFAKSKARVNENIRVRFNDVAGAEEEKEELKEVVDFLKNPKKFSDIGARIPKGVLLVGPPGTGKTLFAKAVAGEANVPFFSISGSDFVEMFVGVGASRVRDLFDVAKKNMPCIVFIDEIDAVGRQRGAGLGGGNDEREQTLNQLLVQMDGFETNDGVIIMAATNRADVLDPALLRPGRFDRQVYVNPPDVKGREEIFKVHSRNKPIGSDVNFKVLARMTSGFTGADIENLLNEAAILAARKNKKVITMVDVNEGINKVVIGPQKKSRIVTETDKRITAYHEAGHAIIAYELENCDPVHEVSIIPRGMAAGYTMTRPDTDDNHITKQKLLDNICMMLGGRVAEELIIKDISTGASNDLQRSSGIARKMVAEWGMNDEIGPIYLGGDQEVFLGRDYQAHNVYSEQIAGKVDEQINKLMKEAYDRAKQILQKNMTVLNSMARLLIERETIYADEIQMLFDGKSTNEIIEFIENKNKKIDEESRETSKPTMQQDVFISEKKIDKPKDDDKHETGKSEKTE